jgi:hypothetical protein
MHDITLGGVHLAAGSTLVPGGDRFGPVVAFGQGMRACIGNILTDGGPARRPCLGAAC